MLTRRRFLVTTAIAAAGFAVLASFPGLAFAQEPAATVDEAELLKPGVLPDMALGNPDAKVKIVEYMSMTCSHCADFHNKTFDEIKAKYIDTGKIYFIVREFPLDPLAAAGFMLARNAPGDKYFDVVSYLFKTQSQWAFVDDPLSGLRNVSKQFGYSPSTFEATLTDQKLLDDINATRQHGADAFGITGTPTFFINGKREVGFMSVDEMSAQIDPLL
ncbi:thioredoxin domain-containing protein [Pleomorphomonas carboxyditropha]|uniref:Disulfide bond formation protein DsbA n=1 Tax=Pleomorphomonas carboxyditropha TaxID=2023338 RepID=A0A2G9WVQ9_9HYPH|nr:thioredoxin domain-containing protein [Pleomorphomonas carboxyditropha]PIO98764.1 disulfide bond formation protein DsbA [Pleomorphomonas carboxyditropha]